MSYALLSPDPSARCARVAEMISRGQRHGPFVPRVSRSLHRAVDEAGLATVLGQSLPGKSMSYSR
jgi:hypothetical protein